jgi:hypothetical protein
MDERIEYLCFAEIHQLDGTMFWRPYYQYASTAEEAAELAIAHLMMTGTPHGERVRELRTVPLGQVKRFEPAGPRPYAVKEQGA